MYIRTRLLTAAAITALVFVLATASASALRSLSFQPSPSNAVAGLLKLTSSGGELIVECPITITRTLVTVIPKRAGTTLGSITLVTPESPNATNCRSSVGRLRSILILEIGGTEKYQLVFRSINGTLPSITGLNLTIRGLHIGFTIEFLGEMTCLYREETEVPVTEELDERQQLARATIGRNTLARTAESEALCPARASLSGTPTVHGQPYTVRLL
jgi:hypothetical protein